MKNSSTPLHVLVTSGGTAEKIDYVRKIANMSTGRLGSLIADAFAQEGASVTYVCGKSAQRPSLPMQGICTVESAGQLGDVLERLLKEQDYDCVVHSMAVSDYTVRSVRTAEELAGSIARALEQGTSLPDGDRLISIVRDAIRQDSVSNTDKKISSNLDDMVLLLKKAPKVIQSIKAVQPHTILVGFKLLVDVEKQELQQVASELLERSHCDYVLANDLEDISGDEHKAMLIGTDGTTYSLNTKQEIAQAIVKCVFNKKGRYDE